MRGSSNLSTGSPSTARLSRSTVPKQRQRCAALVRRSWRVQFPLAPRKWEMWCNGRITGCGPVGKGSTPFVPPNNGGVAEQRCAPLQREPKPVQLRSPSCARNAWSEKVPSGKSKGKRSHRRGGFANRPGNRSPKPAMWVRILQPPHPISADALVVQRSTCGPVTAATRVRVSPRAPQ